MLEKIIPIVASSWHDDVREQYTGELQDVIEKADPRRVAGQHATFLQWQGILMFRVPTDPSLKSWAWYQDMWAIMVSSVLLPPGAECAVSKDGDWIVTGTRGFWR